MDDVVELGGEGRSSGDGTIDEDVSTVGDGVGEGVEAAGPEAQEGVGADFAES
jgi:hypothetical protein